MAEKKIIQIDSVDAYNKLYGWETLHPLVTVVNHPEPLVDMNHTRLNYGLYMGRVEAHAALARTAVPP